MVLHFRNLFGGGEKLFQVPGPARGIIPSSMARDSRPRQDGLDSLPKALCRHVAGMPQCPHDGARLVVHIVSQNAQNGGRIYRLDRKCADDWHPVLVQGRLPLLPVFFVSESLQFCTQRLFHGLSECQAGTLSLYHRGLGGLPFLYRVAPVLDLLACLFGLLSGEGKGDAWVAP